MTVRQPQLPTTNERHLVRVLPRLAAEHRTPLADEVCISITNPRQSPARLTGFADILRLGFHDTDRIGGGFTVMSGAHAADTLEFSARNASVPLTVHCEAGASRSVAIGMFLAGWLGRPLEVVATDVMVPNPWVLNQLRAAALYRSLRRCELRLLRCALFGDAEYLTQNMQ